jgi:hypothetical protein
MTAKPLSISSFEQRRLPHGFPWALFAALVILALVEVGFRTTDPKLVIPYHVPPYIVEQECQAVVDYVDAFGVADVCFVGSSRTRQGVLMPVVHEACAHAFGRNAAVANYAVSGAQAELANAIVHHLLNKGKPRLILCGVSSQALRKEDPGCDRGAAVFWRLSDWLEHYRADPKTARDLFFFVVRNEIARHCLMLRYRERFPALVDDLVRTLLKPDDISLPLDEVLRGGRTPSPMLADFTHCQKFDADRSLVTDPMAEEQIQHYLARILQDGKFPMPQEQVDFMEDTIRLCRAHGVEIALFELPISDLLHQRLPPGTHAGFLEKTQRVCDANDVPFYTLKHLGLTFPDEEFLEHSHVNYHGAMRITQALLDQVIMPRLEEANR